MKLVVLGLSLSSSWGNGHATTFRALLAAFAARGHEVLFLERDVEWYAAHRDLPDPDFCRLAYYDSLQGLDEWREEIAGADAVMVGSYVPDGIAVGRFVQDHARGVTCFYDIDTPVTLARLERDDCDYLSAEVIPGYDIYFSFSGGPTLRRLEQEYGAALRAAALLFGRRAALSPAGRAGALGPVLSRHLQPRPAADAGQAADRTRAAAARPALCRGGAAISAATSTGPPMSSGSSICRPPTMPNSTAPRASR